MKKSLLVLGVVLILAGLNAPAEVAALSANPWAPASSPNSYKEVIKGDVTCPWGALDCNPCVSDVPGNFHAIKRNQSDEDWERTIIPVEARDGEEGVMPELTEHDHIQGMGRIPGYLSSNDVFVFSRSHPAGFFVTYGVPVNNETGSLGGLLEPLFSSDVSWPRVETFFEAPEYYTDHYGGLQLVGRMLFVGGDCLEGGPCSGANSIIDIFDLSPIEAVYWGEIENGGSVPTPLGDPIHVDRIYLNCTNCAGRVAAAKLADGRYLVMASSRFFISDENEEGSLSAETVWNEIYQWSGSELGIDVGEGYDPNFDGRTDWEDYQNVNFVTECETGTLYLVGTGRISLNLEDSPEEFLDDLIHYGDDWLDLFYVNQALSDTGFLPQINITKVGELHMYCNNHEGCNLDASGNIYVTPWRNLVMYASEKDDEDAGDPIVIDGMTYYLETGNNDIYFTEFQNRLEPCPHPETDDSRCFDPWTTDSDGDGLTDADEIVWFETSPVEADTDHDGVIDSEDFCPWGINSEDGYDNCPSEASEGQQPSEETAGTGPGGDAASDDPPLGADSNGDPASDESGDVGPDPAGDNASGPSCSMSPGVFHGKALDTLYLFMVPLVLIGLYRMRLI